MRSFLRQVILAFMLVAAFTTLFYHAVAGADIPTAFDSAALTVERGEITTFTAVGDVMFTRGVGRMMEKYGAMYPLEDVIDELQATDITFLNLETAVSSRGVPLPGKGIWFRSSPESVDVLQEAGVDIVSVANNHSLDYDAPAFLETLELLDKGGILYMGGGEDIFSAREPVVTETGGKTAAFLAYSEMADTFWDWSYPRMLQATEELPGIAPLQEEIILEDLKSLEQVDLVVISLHWGEEYTDKPSEEQRRLAHKLIDAGVDIIIGHHPHWFQGVEYYNGGLIAYSLGNFLFDQTWSIETQQGLLLQAEISEWGMMSAKLKPVVIPKGQSRIASGATAAEILEKLQKLSAELDTAIEINGSAAEVTGPISY